MNRHEFMSKLKNQLRKLPFDEIKEAVEYYEQYFDDAGEENEQEVLNELGSPSAVASQIVAAFAAKDESKSKKMGLSTVSQVILAVFASPIALPAALAVVILAFALVIVLVTIVISVGATGGGLGLYGIAGVVTGILLVAQNAPTALFFFGLGLAAFGIGTAIIIATVQLSKLGFNALAKNMGKFILRRNKK